jgi:hypothetical protein
MNVRGSQTSFSSAEAASRIAGAALQAGWMLLRLPVLAILVILEPLVRVLLGAFALLLVLAALFLECVAPQGSMPFWGMLATAVGCVALLALYYAIVRILSA